MGSSTIWLAYMRFDWHYFDCPLSMGKENFLIISSPDITFDDESKVPTTSFIRAPPEHNFNMAPRAVMKVLKKQVIIEFSGAAGHCGLDLDKAKMVMNKTDIQSCTLSVDVHQARNSARTKVHLQLKTNFECIAGYQSWDHQKQQLGKAVWAPARSSTFIFNISHHKWYSNIHPSIYILTCSHCRIFIWPHFHILWILCLRYLISGI